MAFRKRNNRRFGGRRRFLRRRGGGRRNSPPMYKPRRKGSRGNPKSQIITATYSITPVQPINVTTTTGSFAQLTYSHVYNHVYGSVGRSAPTTAADDFTFVIKGVRVSAPQTFTGKLNFYDVRTNYAETDLGTNASRANCGISYPLALLDPISASSASSTVICAADVVPLTTLSLEFEIQLDVVWKNSIAPAMSHTISSLRMDNARMHLCDLFERAGLDSSSFLNEAVSMVSISDDKKRNAASKLLKSFRGKGSVAVNAGMEYEM